jgi:hypothetical protein
MKDNKGSLVMVWIVMTKGDYNEQLAMDPSGYGDT